MQNKFTSWILSNDEKRSYWRDLGFLACIIGFFFAIMLGSFPLEAPDSARYSEIPREMIVSGDYLTPHLNGVKYFEKPPLFYWLQAGTMKVFGENNWSAQGANALLAILTCLLVYVMARKLYGRKTALFSSLILASSGLFFVMAHIITLDMALTFFLSLSLFSFIYAATQVRAGPQRTYLMWLMYAAAACAIMTKGLVGLIFPGLIILVWIIICKQWRELKTYALCSGIVLMLIVSLPWHLLVQIKNPEFFHFYFFEQHFLRYFTPYAGRMQPFGFFYGVLLVGLFPWTFFLWPALSTHWPKPWRSRNEHTVDLYLIIWPLAILFFYSFSHSQLVPYVLPILPPLAILIGNYVAHFSILNVNRRQVDLAFKLFSAIILLLAMATFFTVPFLRHYFLIIKHWHVYLPASILFLGAVVTYFVYKEKGVERGFITLIFTSMFFCTSLVPSLNLMNHKSIYPLIEVLQPELKADNEVAAYWDYYQDLPYYLKRNITLVGFRGELAFGTEHSAAKDWMIDDATFWQRWNSDKKMFMFTYKDFLSQVQERAAKNKLYLIKQYLDVLLFSNQEPRH
jgi:4-amino-4-deoxy-L-arabinose transferase-like glycosyltransferase